MDADKRAALEAEFGRVDPKVLPRFVLSFPFGLHGELKDVIQSKVLLQ